MAKKLHKKTLLILGVIMFGVINVVGSVFGFGKSKNTSQLTTADLKGLLIDKAYADIPSGGSVDSPDGGDACPDSPGPCDS